MTMSKSPLHDLLVFVEASGGEVSHRIRIQKAVYLLRWLGAPLFENVSFSYHHYGPYSRELSDVLHDAVIAGYLEEQLGPDEYGYTYHICPHAKALNPHEGSLIFGDIVNRLNQEHWRSLELAATALFLQEEEGHPNPAWERALALKPPCTKYLEKARKLYNDLDLYKRSQSGLQLNN